MVTIFALIRDSTLLEIAPSIDAQSALQHFQWASSHGPGATGEVYACRVSESIAAEIRTACRTKQSLGATTPLQMLKRYSASMSKCADVT